MQNVPVRPQSANRARLKKKIKEKKDARISNSTGIPLLDKDNNENVEEGDIFSMIQQVQSVLKNNPEMVAKVSSCVNSLMSNPDIMNKLTSQVSGQFSSQTLQSNSSGESSRAVSNES